MSFRQAGVFDVTITDAFIAAPKFPLGKNDKDGQPNNRNEQIAVWFDVVLKVEKEDGQFDFWHGEISNRSGSGTVSDKLRWELTLQTLTEIGFCLNTIDELMAQLVEEVRADRTVTVIPNLCNPQDPYLASVTVEGAPGFKDASKTFYNIRFLNPRGGGNSGIKSLDLASIAQSFQNGGFFADAPQETATPTTVQPQTQPAQVQTPAPRPGPAAPPRPAIPGGTTAKVPNPYSGKK